MPALLISLLATLATAGAGVEITKCCPEGQQLLEENQCANTTEDHQSWGKFPPKVFSLDAGAFVTETFVVGATALPRCQEGEAVQRLERAGESEESFLILYEDRTLFLTGETASYPTYCLDSGVGGASVALVCTPHPATHCHHSVCVSSCCPESMLFSPNTSDCVFSPHYSLAPPFSAPPPSFLLLHGHPQCEVQVYSREEFRLREDGRLEVEHNHHQHLLNTSQYCLQDIAGPQLESSRMVARVCRPDSDQERDTLDVISRKLTPALLIISEVFLLLTFVLHVIVPEFRKQMFGGCQSNPVYLYILSNNNSEDEKT